MLDSLFSLSMVGMVTELASCVQFQGRVTTYFLPLPLFLRPQAEPTYVSRVFQFVRLKSKESIKERQNKEVKRTKTKSLVAQTSVTKKKKKKEKEIYSSHGLVGYDVALTRRRSPVRARMGIYFSLVKICAVITIHHHLQRQSVRTSLVCLSNHL